MVEKLKIIVEFSQFLGGYPSWIKVAWVLTLILVVFSFISLIAYYPRKMSNLARNAWHAGMGYNACFQVLADENSIITPNLRGLIAQTQPYFDSLGVGVSILEEFAKSNFLEEHEFPLSFKIHTTLKAKHGKDVSAIFRIAQNIGPTTGAMKSYVSSAKYRENINNHKISIRGLTSALAEPIAELTLLPVTLKNEWNKILNSLEALEDRYYDQSTIKEIDAWRNKIRVWALGDVL